MQVVKGANVVSQALGGFTLDMLVVQCVKWRRQALDAVMMGW